MCNSSKKEEKTTPEKATITENQSEYKKLNSADSLKLVNHEIEIKGQVGFPFK